MPIFRVRFNQVLMVYETVLVDVLAIDEDHVREKLGDSIGSAVSEHNLDLELDWQEKYSETERQDLQEVYHFDPGDEPKQVDINLMDFDIWGGPSDDSPPDDPSPLED